MDRIRDLFDSEPFGRPLAVIAVVVVAAIVSRMARFVVRRVIRRLARRSLLRPLGHGGWWRTRERRSHDGADVEQRRRQRIDAASRMIGHITSVVIWLLAVVAIIHVLGVENASSYVSSAGFIGAAVAIGGQHKVNDYITGLGVHFEDRYGVGDELEIRIDGSETITAVVDHVGLFSTRVRDARSTLHFPNSALSTVRNLSQEAAVSTIRLAVPDDVGADEAKSMLRGLAGSHGLTDVVFVGDLATKDDTTGEVELEVRTLRALDDRAKSRLVRRAEALLDND